MNSADSFSASYDQARTRFIESVECADGALERVAHPERDPDGRDLSTDVAWFGPTTAERVLVLMSGTHGVEGYCGSGAQVDWLRRGVLAGVPTGTAVLMIHAINPYGFAWQRRVTEDNVDLNRNWVDFAGKLPENRNYIALADQICPKSWSDEARQTADAALMRYAAERGMPALQQAVSGGQYSHAKGVFYGGAGPTWSRRTQTAIFEHYLKQNRGSASSTTTRGSDRGVTPNRWPMPGERCVRTGCALVRLCGHLTFRRNVDFADIVGDGLSAGVALLKHAEVTCMALEVGTKSVLEVLQALRADAWPHAHGVSKIAGRPDDQSPDPRRVLRRPGRLEGHGRRAVSARLPASADGTERDQLDRYGAAAPPPSSTRPHGGGSAPEASTRKSTSPVARRTPWKGRANPPTPL